MLRLYLEIMRPERWGKRRKSNVPQAGGVLVVGAGVPKKPKNGTEASVKARQYKARLKRIQNAEG
jgi:hypothetical protein